MAVVSAQHSKGNEREKIIMATVKMQHLSLRTFEPTDAAALFTILQQPAVAKYETWSPYQTETDVAEMLQRRLSWDQADDDFFAVTLQGKLIGTAEVAMITPSSAEIAYLLDPAVWGHGLGTELAAALVQFAFETRHYELLTAQIYPENKASQHVLEHLRFQLVGQSETPVTLSTRHVVSLFELKQVNYKKMNTDADKN